jgi:serine/threonine protein kinase
MRQILEGLKHLHEHSIIHRDMKPDNMLLNHKGEVKIIDFGMARTTDLSYLHPQFKQMTQSVTTPIYKAPEVYLSQKLYNDKVDVWACGLVFYELLVQKELMPQDQG